jgi:hypothetical protein
VNDSTTKNENSGPARSRGLSGRTLLLALIGILLVLGVGYDVVHFADYGHKWPPATSERLDLNR